MFRRAPFIWTSKQAIDWGGMLQLFRGGPERRDDGKNRWFLFRKELSLPSDPTAAFVTLTVDGRYQLFINGARVGRGPVRCDPLHQRTDTYDVRRFLQAGDNAIGVLIHVYGVDTAWYQTVKRQWQLVFGDGAFYCDGEIRCGAATIDVVSDESWRCRECDAWDRNTPRTGWGQGFIEVVDATRVPMGWSEPGFDARDWDTVQVLSIGGGPPDSLLGGMKIEPFPTLLPRTIPFLRESAVAPESMIASFGVVPDATLPVDERTYFEKLDDLPAGAITRADALLRADDRTTVVSTTNDRDVAVLLDFGRIHSGYPFVEIDARGGEVIEVAVAEGLPGEWDNTLAARPRIDRERAHGAHVSRYTARPGRQRFEAFEWTAVRYLQLTVRNAPAGLAIRHVGSTFTHYPVDPRGRFECSDSFLTKLWDSSRYTLQLCMHDGWEDCPGREQRQWLGDATVEFLVAQAAFGPSADALNRQFLHHAAESQRPDGLTQMFAPGDHHTDGIVIPDWTLQWILNADLHYLYTGDLDTIAAIFPSIQKALAWFDRHTGAHGLVADMPHWHFHDWAALGRHGEATTLNAQLAGCLRAAARLARALEAERAAREYDARADRIAAGLNARAWDAERGVYVDSVDPASGRQDRRVSQHGNAAMMLWGDAPPARWPAIIAAISDPQRLVFTAAPPIVPSGGEFDAERNIVLANTFYSHFVYRALIRASRFDLVLGLIRERYGPMLARGATTLWESFDPTASLCHGFSTTPLFQLSAEMLGVQPTAPGFAKLRVAPQLGDCTFARGVFPTAHGDVHVSWEKVAADLQIDITIPDGCSGELEVPSGYELADGDRRLSPGHRQIRCRRAQGGKRGGA